MDEQDVTQLPQEAKVNNLYNYHVNKMKQPQQVSTYPEGITQPQKYINNDFTGGLNTDTSPINLAEKELQIADNVDFSERGSIKKRKGGIEYNNTPYNQHVERLFEWRTSDGQTELMAVMEDEYLYRIIDSDNIEQIRKLISTHIDWFVLNEYLYIVDGNNYYRIDDETFTSEVVPETDQSEQIEHDEYFTADLDIEYDLTYDNLIVDSETVTDDEENEYIKDTDYEMNYLDGIIKPLSTGSMQNGEEYNIVYEYEIESDNNLDPIKSCKYIVRHPKSYRIFAAGNINDPSALYYSEYNQPDYFKEVSVLYTTTNDGAIQGLQVFDELLLVFFKNSVWAWRGLDPASDVVWEKLPLKHGTFNHRGIAETEGALTFLDNSGIYAISPQKGTQNITDGKISNEIKTISNRNNIHSTYDSKNHRYLLSYSDTTGRCDKVLTLDWNLGAYARWTNLVANDFCYTDDGKLLMATENYIMEMNESINTDINFHIKSKKIVLGTPYDYKLISKIFASLSNYTENTKISFNIDDENKQQIIEVNNLIIRINLFEKGIEFEIEIEDNSDEEITLYNWGMDYRPVMTYQEGIGELNG